MASPQVHPTVHDELNIHRKPKIQHYKERKKKGENNQPHQLHYKNFVDF
jgi:hypothetical protein